MSKIVFCNKDSYHNFDGDSLFNSECRNAQWADGFYRRIQIFDLKYSVRQSVFSAHQFEDDGVNGMLVGLHTILNNQIIDLVGNGRGRVISEYNPNYEQIPNPQNLDGTNFILYGSNFCPQGGIPNWGDRYYISGVSHRPPRLNPSKSISCSSNCKLCAGGSCLTCKEGYSLFSTTCKGNVDAESSTATYFYKNPGINMPERLTLNIDFNQLFNEPYFTLFFFIKIYGFTKKGTEEHPIKLLIFDQERKENGELEDTFYLAFHQDTDKEQLSFYVNKIKMFSYNNYRDNNFGYWVPISFTAFRESDRTFKMNMVQASIQYDNLALDSEYLNSMETELFPYVKITQFTITNKWVGLLCDVKIYNKFMVNAWGIIRTIDPSDSGASQIEEISLRSDSSDSCLSTNQILNQPASGYKIECVPDYNPHLKNCGSTGTISRYSQSPSCSSSCIYGGTPNKCLGNGYTSIGDRSYENQNPIWKKHFPIFSGNKIDTGTLYYIDYNRYKFAKAKNIASPQDVWSIDFWFRTGTNQSVRKRGDINIIGSSGYNQKTMNNNNFNEFIIEWNYHIRLRVYKKEKNEITGEITYMVECTPLVVVEHRDLSSKEIYENDISDVHYEWSYVTCGVNFQEKMFYMTNTNKLTEEKTFTSDLILIPSDKTTLTITENSRSGYGFTFIYQLRLWHCYNCAQSFRNLDYDRLDRNFNEVLHNFDGTETQGGITQSFSDQAGGTSNTDLMVQAADFPGYTISFANTNSPKLCDESDYQYYNEKGNNCQYHYNLARVDRDLERTILSSRNQRYTIEFWFFVENSAELSPGVNVYWENHMSLTILRDTSNKNTINAICFPQSYRDKVDGLKGQEIIELYDKAINKDKYAFYQGSSKWNFVRCAVDQTRKIFFINDNLELDLEGEILYGTTRNYRPFRNFKLARMHALKIQNARYNPTRIYIRQIRCYREYIDFRLMDLKYINCQYFSSCDDKFPFVFCFDFGEKSIRYYDWANETAKDSYKIYNDYWNVLSNDLDPYYTTFPDIYMPNFCAPGQGGGDKESCSGSYTTCALRNSSTFFWPTSNGYLNLDTLRQGSSCEDSCRPPDSYESKNFCLMKKKNKYNMVDCGSSISSAYESNYYDNYKCDKGYVQVYYECIEEKKVVNSAMYFSNFYSFPNVVFSPSITSEDVEYGDYKTETRLVSYYIEVWMKLDTLNYRKQNTEVEHYLFAHPHQIIKDPLDQKFKYSNRIVSQGTYYYTLNSISYYEWNKIIIENSYDRENKKFTITFYLNYEFDNPEFSIPDLEAVYKLHFRGFGFCNVKDTYCRVNDNPAYLNWGVAWYRNFRVWDADITSLQSIQTFEYGYTEYINALKYYFPLSIDTIYKNRIRDIIAPDKNYMQLNFWHFHAEQNFQRAFDDDFRENYSTNNFDKTLIYENNYISGLNEDGTDYLISSCASECKRCYSSSKTDCYECKTGYCLYGKQCKIRSGFFLKTPPNYDIDHIDLKIKDDSKNYDLEKMNPVTITLYIKFFGIENEKIKSGKAYYTLVCFYKKTVSGKEQCLTYIGYNNDEKTIVFVIDGIEVYSTKVKKCIGVWTHFGISIHREEGKDYFPNMLNFMIDQEILIPKSNYNPSQKEVNINCFYIDTAPISYYSSFKVFSTFYFGSYGHVNAISSTRGSKLVYQINFYGSSTDNCLNDGDLLDPSTINTYIISPKCSPDYHPYEDNNNICSDNSHFMDVIYKVTPPCELCDTQCTTNCFGLGNNECTCDYYEGLYWIKTDEEYQSYECEKVDSINFAFYDSVTINGLNVVENDEMTMSFWLNIYEYVKDKFDSLEIIWNQHLAVKVNKNINDDQYLEIECHGDYDTNDLSMVHTIIKDSDNIERNKWNYIICQVDKFHNVMRVNNLPEETYTPVTYADKSLTSFLRITDTTSNFNYGFSFVRELKLFSSYNFDIWDESLHNIKKKHFDYLLHHFHNTFNETRLENAKIKDEVEGLVTKLTPKSNRIGYNYVKDYEYLIICEEGYVYNENTKICDLFSSENCIVPRTNQDKCLLCNSNNPYLKEEDDLCYNDCGIGYFADNYFKQCRKCHETCYTCSGKYNNNCLSCTNDYYYIESKHICVKNCQEYGLVISTEKLNTCKELYSKSYITIPVYLNNSYDYNPLNDDYISKIIDRDQFFQIEGHLDEDTTGDVSTKWIYNRTETLKLNEKYRYYDIRDFPESDYPFDVSEESQLTINVNNDYFKNGYKYVFYLQIFSQNGAYITSHLHKYILIMNDYPIVGKINILPSKGYITNIYLITINKCKDDVSEKKSLHYKFSYFKKKNDILSGHNETSSEEIIIQEWSRYSEVLYQFPELNPDEGYKYYIRGYCRDEFEVFDTEIQEVEVYDIPSLNNKPNISLAESISSIDLDEELTSEQLLKRAEFLSKATQDFEKEEYVINRTNITIYNNRGLFQENLILYDPQSSPYDPYCNYQGHSYVEYFYLICDCNGYDGVMCQIDHSSFNYVVNVYNKLFYKIKRMQGGTYNQNLIKALNLIMKSAATFMEIENMDFMLESIEFINLYKSIFANKMIEGNNYELYFDIYNSLIEYGLSIVNKLKYRNFIKTNTKNAGGYYNSDKFRNALLAEGEGEYIRNYFNKVKVGLQNLLEFYASNKKEVRFINRNINVYVFN